MLQSGPALSLVPSSLAQWLAAVGTIGAVIIALFKDSLLLMWRKPRLSATININPPCTVKTPIIVQSDGVVGWAGDCYYIRIRIENVGRTRAEKAQVFALRLQKQGADGRFVEVLDFLPLYLKWANSPQGAPVVTIDGISPKMVAFCDFVAVCDPSNPTIVRRPAGVAAGTTIGELQLEVAPFTNSDLLAPGKYRLTIRIGAANATPVERTAEFTHTGVWTNSDPDMRRDSLGVLFLP